MAGGDCHALVSAWTSDRRSSPRDSRRDSILRAAQRARHRPEHHLSLIHIYELWEDLGFRAPDNIVTPCGAGSNVLGCAIGFSELLRAGEISKLPRIFAVQPANCGPIATAFLAGTDAAVDTVIQPTIAEGTAIAQPIRRREVIAALRDSGGGAVLVSEASIESGLFELARTGVYVEPTSAQVVAGFSALLTEGKIGADETTVLVMTGAGLKATARIAELLGIAS